MSPTRLSVLLAAAWLAGTLSGIATSAGHAAEEAIVATYQGGQISQADYESWLAFRGLTDDPAVRHHQLGDLALHLALAADLEASEGGIGEAMERKLESDATRALAAAYRRHHVLAVSVPEEIVRARTAELDAQRHKPAKVKLRNLFKRVPHDASDAARQAARAEMEGLREKLLAGADFGELARRASDSETRFRGGRMGIAAPGDLPPGIEEIAFALAPGALSAIIEGPSGFTLLRVDEVIAARTLTREEARERVRQHLLKEARAARWAALRGELLRQAAPRYDLAAARKADSDAIVARFTGGVLRRSDLLRALDRQLTPPAVAELTDDQVTARLEAMVVEQALARRARSSHLDRRPDVRANLRWQRVRSLAAEALRRDVERRFTPLEPADLVAYWRAHRDDFVLPERHRVRVIRLDAEPGAIAQAFRHAESLAAAIRSGELRFADAARTHSRHPSAARGGELEALSRKQLAGFGRSFFETTTALALGAVSEPIREGDVVWLIESLGVEARRPMTFEEAERLVRKRLGQKETEKLQQAIERAHREALALRTVPFEL